MCFSFEHNRLGESPLGLKLGQRTFNVLFLELNQYKMYVGFFVVFYFNFFVLLRFAGSRMLN